VLTVSNRPGYPAQYTTFATAHTAASPGDTLYFTPSPNTYGSVSIAKGITIIGGGYAAGEHAATFGTITIANGASNASVIGVLASAINLSASTGLSNITIERCRVPSITKTSSASYTVDGLVIRQNALQTVSLGSTNATATNVVITNNVFAGSTSGTSISGSAAPTVMISHNIFTGLSSSAHRSLGSLSNALVTDNIFYGRAPAAATGVSDCTFSNNLSFGTYDNTLPPAGNTGAGNVVNEDPLFVDVPAFNPAIAVLSDYDFHLGTGSPALGTGSDGSDMGMHGGVHALTVPLDGHPRLPQVTSMGMPSAVVGQDGSVEAEAEGTKHD
jgi:hypothetical protein